MATPASPIATPAETAAIVGRFRSVLRRASLILGSEVVVILVGVVFVVLWASVPGVPALAVLMVWFVLVAALVFLWYVNWRCPACGSYLGKAPWDMFRVERCLTCGTRLI